jgi:hypothetical protein
MRMGWLMTLVLVIAATMPPITVRQARAQEAQGEQTGDCPHERGWKPKRPLTNSGRAPGMDCKVEG